MLRFRNRMLRQVLRQIVLISVVILRVFFLFWQKKIRFEMTIPVWVYICDGHQQISIPFHFFSVKSSCALVTWEEMVISPRARFLPGEKWSCPGRNYHFLPGNECAWRFHRKICLARFLTYGETEIKVRSNINSSKCWGLHISSHTTKKKTEGHRIR